MKERLIPVRPGRPGPPAITAKPATVLTGPDLSKALTPQQINDAYVKFIEQTFHIDHTS